MSQGSTMYTRIDDGCSCLLSEKVSRLSEANTNFNSTTLTIFCEIRDLSVRKKFCGEGEKGRPLSLAGCLY